MIPMFGPGSPAQSGVPEVATICHSELGARTLATARPRCFEYKGEALCTPLGSTAAAGGTGAMVRRVP